MILNKEHLAWLISPEEQQKEVERLKAAKVGETLFIEDKINKYIIDSLLNLAQVSYTIFVGNEIRYVKTK